MSCVAECCEHDGCERGYCKDELDGLVGCRVAFVIVVKFGWTCIMALVLEVAMCRWCWLLLVYPESFSLVFCFVLVGLPRGRELRDCIR